MSLVKVLRASAAPLNEKVLDSGAPLSAIGIAQAKAQGFRAILRYLHTLTPAEVQFYTDHDFYVGLLYEMDPAAVLGGRATGIANATTAVAQAQALKPPAGQFICYSTDIDPASIPGGPAGAVPYYEGTASVTRPAGFLNVAYIGAAAANACLQAHAIDRVFIPDATSWADGATPGRVDALQGFTIVFDGTQFDNDLASPTLPFWNYKGVLNASPAPSPSPSPQPAKGGEVPTLFICTDVAPEHSRAQLVQGVFRLGLNPAETAKWDAFLRPLGQVQEGPYWVDLVSALPQAG